MGGNTWNFTNVSSLSLHSSLVSLFFFPLCHFSEHGSRSQSRYDQGGGGPTEKKKETGGENFSSLFSLVVYRTYIEVHTATREKEREKGKGFFFEKLFPACLYGCLKWKLSFFFH